jgi:hypothetical protein
VAQAQFINVLLNFLVYSDGQASSSPQLKDIDYNRQLTGKQTGNSFSRRFEIPAAGSLSIVDNTRTISGSGTTQFDVELVTGNVYRYINTGGTALGLKTHRATTEDATTQFTVTKVGDVVRYDHTGGTAPGFSGASVAVGDILTVEEGSPFNVLNEGVFTIVTVGVDFVEVLNSSGVAEGPITLGAPVGNLPSMIEVSAPDEVQVGDQVNITNTAFNIENRGIFTVTAVTPFYFEVENGNPGIPETGLVAGVTGLVFYPDIFKWLYIESDQKVSVRVNGNTSDDFEIEPLVAANPDEVGVYLQRGGVFSLTIANNGLTPANVKVSMAE